MESNGRLHVAKAIATLPPEPTPTGETLPYWRNHLVKRRHVFLGAGALASGGLVRSVTARPPHAVDVKIWLTEGAAAHSRCRDRAAGYLRRSIEEAGVPLRVAFGETTVDPGDRSARATERRFWPQQVLQGGVGLGGIDPVDGVNLLITDGEVNRPTAGYAHPHIAAVPGARHLAEMDPADEASQVFPYTVRAAVTQLLIHEVGHALGLDHDHGAVSVGEGTVTATPMIGGYAWASDHGERTHGSTCGDPLDGDLDGTRQLSMTFSDCAARALRA